MKHRIQSKKLNRSSGHRKALFKNLAKSLVLYGSVTTTETKAKVIQPIAEKLLTQAKNQTLHSRRLIQQFFNDKAITNQLVDQIAPQLEDRTSGFTRISRIGFRRGDNAMMASLSLVDKIQPVVEVSPTDDKKSATPKKSSSKTK